MYGVLVVDDEYYVRASVINRTDWASLGLKIVGQAADGWEALDKLRELTVDIVIVDIRMPGMNGLEFLELARAQDSRLQFIVLSGYNEFEYARTALRNQAIDYLLKPVDPEELRSTLKRCVEALDAHEPSGMERLSVEARERIQLEHYLADPRPGEKNVPAIFRDRRHAFLLVYAKAGLLQDTCRLADSELKRLCKGSDIRSAFATSATRREMRIALTGEALEENYVSRAAMRLAALLEASGVRVAWAHSDSSQSADLYGACVRALEYRMLCGSPSPVAGACGIPEKPDAAESESMARLTLLFSQAAHEQDAMRAHQALTELLSRTWSCPQALHWIIQSILVTAEQYALRHNIPLDDDLGRMARTGFLMEFEAYEQLRLYMIDVLMRFLFHRDGEQMPQIVDQIELYIEKHLADDLRVEVIAKEFFLSVSYISQLFKRKTGVPISGYIESRRIERAKLLLIQRRMSVTEIAARVGYADSAYFTRAFKRCAGLAPKKYQQIYGLGRADG